MAGLVEDFARCADIFGEALLLVTSSGEIRAANHRARAHLFGSVAPPANARLTDFVAEPAEKLREYLRLCARSGQKLPGRLTAPQPAGRDPAHFITEGWACDVESAPDALVVLRLLPKQESIQRFAALNRQVETLQREVTKRVHAERSAQEQQEMLRVTLNSIGDAVITTDTEGLTTFMNPVAERLTGWTEQDAVGRPLEEIFVIRHEETGAEVESPVAKVLEHGMVVGLANHTVLVRKDGTRIPIDDSGAPIRDASGEMFGVVLVFHEISQRRAMERRMLRQAEALREADRRKDEFLAMLAHELRNPLAPLHSAVQVLKLRGRDGDIEQISALMERQTAHLTRLVDDLLDIARITRGTIQLERNPVSLAQIIEHAVETVKPVIEKRTHRLRLNLPDEAAIIHADFTRLSQVFCNLLNNAAKFMDPGGEIEVEASTEGAHALVIVRDQGRGMDEAMLTRVFDLFIQGERSLDRREGGLGVGLTLVKTLVEMHDGSISAFSQGPGRGSEFVVHLPLGPAHTLPAPRAALVGGALRINVLVVDDNADAAESLALLLEHWGCRVRTAENGKAALGIARGDPPDAVLLDIGLPEMDGYEVARRLRQLPGMSKTRIIAVTGYGRESDRQRAALAGFDEHLTKPVRLDELRALLES